MLAILLSFGASETAEREALVGLHHPQSLAEDPLGPHD
jgi:hypothetical protein